MKSSDLGGGASAIVTPEQVLEFWFGTSPPNDVDAQLEMSKWFTKSEAFDGEVGVSFGTTIEAALNGELDAWARDSFGWLALLIVLDQFTRNVFRGRPESFGGDAAALHWSELGKARGWDRTLPLMARPFVYLPLEHAEDMVRQDRSVASFEELLEEANSSGAPEKILETLRSYLDFAQRHRDVIKRFGRFPHRNSILDRESTEAEREYLAQPGAGF